MTSICVRNVRKSDKFHLRARTKRLPEALSLNEQAIVSTSRAHNQVCQTSPTKTVEIGGLAFPVREMFEAKFDDGEHVILDITALNAALDRLNVRQVMAAVTPALRRQVSENGLEADHLERLRAAGPDFRPATQIMRGPHAWIVDGNHRAHLWIEAGSAAIPVRIAPELLWRLYIVRQPLTEIA